MDGRTIKCLSAAAVFLAVVLFGCAEPDLESNWLDREITIDGKNPEWAGAEAYYSEEQGIKIGFFNDEHDLYVYLAMWHRQDRMQVLMNGLTVWFDEAGGRGKTFGIEYPLQRRMEASEFPMRERGFRGGAPGARGEAHGFPDSLGTQGNDPKMLADMLVGARSILEILCPAEGAPRSVSLPDSSGLGVAAMIGIVNRTLIYELKVPLQRTGESSCAIDAKPGQRIGIGFIVGKRERRNVERPEGGSPGEMGGQPGGMGGPSGGMGGFPGGGMGGPGGMRGGAVAEPLELWTKVRLAVKPAGGSAK